ncbi:opsin 7, group member a [Salvelinus alpinus]|uniref:opsin 7, group member a n=1 Tax=Salvelinus alpinus TaxID=8036 RepID=UPI0039FD3D9C
MTGGVPSILRELYRLRLAESENHREVCVLWWVTPYYSVSYNKKMLLKPAEFFTINLAVSDLGMTLSLYPLAVTSSIYHRWLYGKTVCLVYAFCGVLFGICSLTTLTILSTVCCLKVCYPLYGNRFCPDHGRILIACAWAYALVFACSPLAHWGAYGPEPYGTACCIDWQRSNRDSVARSYTVALFLCCYVLPCCVITSAYSQILVTVRESRRAVEQHVSQQTHMGNVQTTIVKLSVAVCIGFFTAWSPYALVSMWAAFGHMDSIPPMAFAIPAVFAKSSTLYNPLVYLLLKPNFRHLLSKDLHSLHRACVFQCRCVRHLLSKDLHSLHRVCVFQCRCVRHLLSKDLHSLHRACVFQCRCVRHLRRFYYRSVLAVTLRWLCPRGSESNSAPNVVTTAAAAHAVLCSSQCPCEHCQDTFECFKQYPRCCHVNVNTVQLSLQDSVSPVVPPAPGPPVTPGKTPPPVPNAKKSVRVIVSGRKSSEIDSLEITLETVPSHYKAARP